MSASDLPPPPSSSLSSLARSKLLSASSGGSKDSCSLHRWVLLKNSLIRSTPDVSDSQECDGACIYSSDDPDEDDEEEFMFPDPGHHDRTHASDSSEAEWLDSLLETLGDAEEPDADMMDVHVSVLSVDDEDDDPPFTPFSSPASSSDDLVGHALRAHQPSAQQYPIPYPPVYHPPLLYPFDFFASDADVSVSPPYADALPFTYYDHGLDELPVPDAIEDTSDDESDAPLTPWGRSTSSLSLPLVDPAAVPLPSERTRGPPLVSVFLDMDDAFFNPFELDPLPFADEPRTFDRDRSLYQEC